jgi:diaminopropionate ammonia-lyase
MLFENPRHSPGARPDVITLAGWRAAREEIASWPGYAPTPLRELADLGFASVHYKDEGSRFGLGSFKALGGAYALKKLVAAHGARITVCCATDGNHGRSVAWGAQRSGCRCVIFLHERVSRGREEAIRALGAEIVRTPGTYDDAVRAAARAAGDLGWFVVSDTSYPGYAEIPVDVMHGYTVMAGEILEQIPAPPTHVFLQGGVGGMAAAVAGHFVERGLDPVFIVVEPEQANCLQRSARAGVPTPVPGDHDTLMACLACGEVSEVAWPLLRDRVRFFQTVPDEAAAAAMRFLARQGIAAGESGGAGLAGLLWLTAEERAQAGLGADSRVLLIGTEGPTDPEIYRRVVEPAGPGNSESASAKC